MPELVQILHTADPPEKLLLIFGSDFCPHSFPFLNLILIQIRNTDI
jgi:hypothetical protein